MSPPDPDEQERHELFLRLFMQHEQGIYAHIASLLLNWTEADEVMQETSVALWKMFDQFEEGTSFGSWARRVAYFRVLKFREQRARDRHTFDNTLAEALLETSDREEASRQQRRTFLSQCIETLKLTDQELLTQCYADRRTIKQVADAIGRPAKGVYNSLARIRRALFACVERKLAAEERA